MTPYDKIRAALEIADRKTDVFDAAKAALAELERVAAPVPTQEAIAGAVADILGDAYHCTRAWSAWSYGTMTEDDFYSVSESDTPNEIAAKVAGLYAAPPAPVVEIREAVITDEVARKVFNAWIDARWRLNEGQDAKYGHAMINVVRAELGPALGLVEIREPTPEECADMAEWFKSECLACCINSQESADYGRAIFDAVKIVMWPKSEGS